MFLNFPTHNFAIISKTKDKQMKKLFLILTILGFALNMTTMWNETVNHGNILLWGDSDRTFAGAFATEISSIFMYDLFYVVLVFSIWLVFDAKKLNIRHS